MQPENRTIGLRRIHELLAKGEASHIAVRDHDGTAYTYAELSALVDNLAAKLAEYGVRPGDRVMLVAENSVQFLATTLALSRLDAWTVFANARLVAAEVERLAAVADIRGAIFTAGVSEAARTHAATMQGRSLGQWACGELMVSPLRDAVPEAVDAGPEQIAALIYTSGTAGEPKGVMLTHGNLLFTSRVSSTVRQISSADVTLAVLPGTHIFGFASVILGALAQGSQLIFVPRFDVDEALRLIQSDVTLLPAVPQIFAALLRRLNELGTATPPHKLRYIYAGGAPLDLGLKRKVEQVFGIPLHNGYGQTEASPSIAGTRIENPSDDVSIGFPLPGVEVLIHEPNAEGIGELWVRGPNVMRGYFRNPEATCAALTDDGFLRTGDLARRDQNGALHIAGRLKELIVHSGFNVYPPEVEAVLNLHPAVSLCAVVGLTRGGDEDVIAFVKVHGEVTEAELRDWVRARMAPYKVPARVIIADTLPEATVGKVLKGKLLEHFRAQLEEGERG